MKLSHPTLIALTAACAVWSVDAQTFADAVKSAEADLQKAGAELSVLNERIALEKLPLARRLNELEAGARDFRRKAEEASRLAGSAKGSLSDAEKRVDAAGKEVDYLAGLLTEFTRAFESRIHISELQLYEDVIEASKSAADSANLTQAQKFEHQVKVLQSALNRLDQILGGHRFEGRALTPERVLETGNYALYGPIAVFASDRSGAAGLVDIRRGSAEPNIIPLDPEWIPGIKSLATTGSGELPVDATLGNALKIASTRETWLEHVKKGGPVMIPLLSLAVLAALIGVVKWVQLSGVQRARSTDLNTILGHVRQGETDQARQVAKGIRGPAGELLAAAVDHSGESKELLEEILYERMLNNKPKLERLMPFIALTAATAPLLGLLGTVTGMINTFKMITVFGTGDPKLLSAGISEALITTEYGLIIAVPCLLLHALLNRKAKGVISSMEQTAVGFINGLPTR